MSAGLSIVVAALTLGGAFFVLVSAIAMLRERDAYARINVLGPATGLGLPALVVAAYMQEVSRDGFEVSGLVRSVVTLVALVVVSSVGSNMLARAAYLSGAPVDPATQPQDLADDPD